MSYTYKMGSRFTGDKRTNAQRLQHDAFHLLGTIARTKTNIRSVSNYCLHPKDQELLNRAIGVINEIEKRTRKHMSELPSKRNEKLRIDRLLGKRQSLLSEKQKES